MGESSSRRRRVSKGFKEHLFLNSRISKFGRCALALWPDNAAKVLAERARCTERAANLWIEGRRRPSARAVLAIAGEID